MKSKIGAALLVLGSQVAAFADDLPSPTVSPAPPADVRIPAGFGNNPIAFFDDYSWRVFVALNWPAKVGLRGEPDTNKEFGALASRTVWSTFKADHEVFQPGGLAPTPWSSFDALSPDPMISYSGSASRIVLGGFGRAASELQIEHFNQAAFGQEIGSLASNNRKYVRYEVRMNKPHFEFIRTNKLYLFDELPGPNDPQLIFPTGSIEVKAAWRQFTDAELANAALMRKFYSVDVVLIDPDLTRRETKVGLVGLHIVHRTPSRPEWIWSTFEHVTNLEGASPTFLRGSPGDGTNRLLPVVNEHSPPLADPDPVPIHRVKPIHNSTVKTNDLYRSHPDIRDTIWANYQLVMTQWPVTPAKSDEEFRNNFRKAYPAGAGTPFPADAGTTSIANITMETTDGFQRNFSCMRCHFRAGTDHRTEFVWTVPLRAWRPNRKDVQSAAENFKQASENLLSTFKIER